MVDTYILCAWYTTYLFSRPLFCVHVFFFSQSFCQNQQLHKYTNTNKHIHSVCLTHNIFVQPASAFSLVRFLFVAKLFVKISKYEKLLNTLGSSRPFGPLDLVTRTCFGSKKFWLNILLSIFSLNWTIIKQLCFWPNFWWPFFLTPKICQYVYI